MTLKDGEVQFPALVAEPRFANSAVEDDDLGNSEA
jgi:hypothetical protein